MVSAFVSKGMKKKVDSKKKNEYRACNRESVTQNRYMIILHNIHTIVIVRVTVTNKINYE